MIVRSYPKNVFGKGVLKFGFAKAEFESRPYKY